MGKNYTVKEVAKKLRVSTTYVYNLIESGDLQKIEGLKGVIRIPSEELRDKFGNAGIRDYFQYDSTKVDVIETSLGKVRKIKNQDLYVLVDITKALALSTTYAICKVIDDKYVVKLTKEKSQDYGFFSNGVGILLISADGIKEYSTKSKNKSKVDKLIKELCINEVKPPVKEKQTGLQVFKNEEFGQVRIVTKENEIWFVGKDVADILGYQNGSKAVSTHVDDEDRILEMIPHSQNGNMVRTQTSLINESGLYSLVLSSKLPTAKKFKRWVTSEVLPSIRQTGGYVSNAPKFIDNYFSNFSIELRQEMISELETKINQLSIDKEKIDNQLLESIKAIDEIKNTL